VARPACWQENNNPAADNRLRVAVVAVAVVVPLAVLVLCLSLPRRESVRPPSRPAVEQLVAAAPAVVPDADRTSPAAANNPGPAPQKEALVEHPVAVAPLPAEQEGKAAADVPVENPLPAGPARVEKPLASLTVPARDDGPLLPVDALSRPGKPAGCETCRKAPAGDYGTALHFARDPQEAAKLAKADNKLMAVFTISGNFEDSKFT
jgi:hypothetical protein